MTRYNMDITSDVYQELKKIAERDGTTIAELLRRATRLYLYVHDIKQDPGARLMVRRGDETQEIVVDLI
jgi:hypothetical protein